LFSYIKVSIKVLNKYQNKNKTKITFFLLTPLDHTPYRRIGMSYQVEELVVPALAHVVGSGITVDCGIMYVPNGWWKHRWAAS
jgi:hypothetical protein